jgi:hypothetical protein
VGETEDNQIRGIFVKNGGYPRPSICGGRCQPLVSPALDSPEKQYSRGFSHSPSNKRKEKAPNLSIFPTSPHSSREPVAMASNQADGCKQSGSAVGLIRTSAAPQQVPPSISPWTQLLTHGLVDLDLTLWEGDLV